MPGAPLTEAFPGSHGATDQSWTPFSKYIVSVRDDQLRSQLLAASRAVGVILSHRSRRPDVIANAFLLDDYHVLTSAHGCEDYIKLRFPGMNENRWARLIIDGQKYALDFKIFVLLRSWEIPHSPLMLDFDTSIEHCMSSSSFRSSVNFVPDLIRAGSVRMVLLEA
jgi:hypothetical protein